MFSSILISIIVIIFLVLFIFYKRDMLIKVFSLNLTTSANQFQEQIEETADIVIHRLEEQIIHLEELLVEADIKIKNLDNKIYAAKLILEKQNEEITAFPSQDRLVTLDSESGENVELYSNDASTIIIPVEGNSKLGIDDYKAMEPNDRRIHILAMVDQGYNSTEIAQITGISKGEIMLRLQLDKK